MTDDQITDDELRRELRGYAASASHGRTAPTVVTAAIHPPSSGTRRWTSLPALLAVAVVSLAVVAVGVGLVGVGPGGTRVPFTGSQADAATAVVGETEYAIDLAQDLNVRGADLVRIGTIASTNVEEAFADFVVFQLASLDPRVVLVARNHPDHHQPGTHRLLWGPDRQSGYPAICPFLERSVREVSDGCD